MSSPGLVCVADAAEAVGDANTIEARDAGDACTVGARDDARKLKGGAMAIPAVQSVVVKTEEGLDGLS